MKTKKDFYQMQLNWERGYLNRLRLKIQTAEYEAKECLENINRIKRQMREEEEK